MFECIIPELTSSPVLDEGQTIIVEPTWLPVVRFAAWVVTLTAIAIYYGLLQRRQREFIEGRTLRAYRRLRTARTLRRTSEVSIGLVSGITRVVYGRTAGRTVTMSLLLSVAYTTVIIGISWTAISHDELSRLKRSVEREASPELAVAPAEAIARARESKVVMEGDFGTIEYIHNDPESVQIRALLSDFPRQLYRQSRQTENSQGLFLLWLIEGTYVDEGVQWGSFLGLYLFNGLGDLTAVFLLKRILRLASVKGKRGTRTGAILLCPIASTVLFLVSVIPYGHLAGGAPDVFVLLLFKLPLIAGVPIFGLVLIFLGASVLRSLTHPDKHPEINDLFPRIVRPFVGLGAITLGVLSGLLFRALVKNIDFQVLSLPHLPSVLEGNSLNLTPYLLAGTTLIPLLFGTLVFVAFVVLGALGDLVKCPIAFYLKVILNMRVPLVIALCSLPAGITEGLVLFFEVF